LGRGEGVDAVAGYGTGARPEYLMIPLSFGFGAPLVEVVGTSIGAHARALRIALTGSGLVFAIMEAVGIAAAICLPAVHQSISKHIYMGRPPVFG
jgi:Na+-driven multidrug efflux pump